jgi:hypothetical protein
MLSDSGHYAMHIVVVFVVLLSAFAWFPISILNQNLHPALRIAVGIIGILAFIVILNRDIYLPFLADSALPASLLPLTPVKEKLQPEDIMVKIKDLPANVKVVYWAAENGDPRSQNRPLKPRAAYGSYENSGVVISDNTGNASCVIKCPQQYNVKYAFIPRKIPKHLHYRFTLSNGMLSRVYTHPVTCDNKGAVQPK